MNPATQRQQLLWLWTADSNLASRVIAWTFVDGTDLDRDQEHAPYDRGADALADGWRLIQASTLQTRPPGAEFTTGVLEFEWLLERIVDLPPGPNS
jgi:hypothetical protein